jgi:hypothetical protein
MCWAKAEWLSVALCCAALLPLVGSPAAADTPTVQELLAAQDKDLENQLVGWGKSAFALPDDLALDEPLRQAATQVAQEHVARLRKLWPVWIAQERAESGDLNLRGNALSQPLYLRAINEMAIWTIESGGPAQDDAWLKAALAPTACRSLFPSYLAQRIAMIQAAPLDARPALLAGERELLSRWGTKRPSLPPRPLAADLAAVDQAITRLRAGLPVTAEPMTAYLAGQVFNRDRNPGKSDRWEQCAKSQWWLASQLARGKVDRTAALTLYRYSMMLDVHEFVPTTVGQKAAATRPTEGKPAYPPVAAYFQAEGSTTVQAETDALGKFLKARVISRKIAVPGVRDNPPVAFETLLDAASLDYAEKRSYPAGKATTLQFEMVWRLREGEDEAR